MKDSIVGDAWVKEACALNPIHSQGDGVFIALARLEFNALFKPFKNKPKTPADQPKESYKAALLFPPFINTQLIDDETTRLGAAAFPASYVGGKLYQVGMPLRDQGELANKAGYTPGLKFLNASSKSKPLVYDRPPAMALLTEADAHKVYSGMWVIANFRLYVAQEHKRVAAALNGVTLYYDDAKLASGGGAGPNPDTVRSSFAGVRMTGPIAVPNIGQQNATPAQAYNTQPPMSEDEYLRAMGL